MSPRTPPSRTVAAHALAWCLIAALAAAPAAAQDTSGRSSDGPPPGGTVKGGPPPDSPTGIPTAREDMWRPPTDDDWAKPCLLTFQRTWEDALAVSRETRKPILVCVNMDGEIASEHYAGVRYRQPDIAALYEPYVLVLATVYRHSPRDYDEQGRRVLCPRFGSVTCGEHIAIEPILYERYFEGQRIAPRHIMIEPDGREVYDVFYANDTASVFRTITTGIAERKEKPPVIVRGDRPVIERVGSRDVVDRMAVEGAYRDGDAAQRKALLDAAAGNAAAAPVDLLRLGVFGLDPDLARSARQALVRVETPAATGLIVDALKAPMDTAEKDALLNTLSRLGRTNTRARWLSTVHRGLGGTSTAIDMQGWTRAGGTYAAPGEPAAAEPTAQGEGPAAPTVPADAAADVADAERSLEQALEARDSLGTNRRTTEAFAQLLFEDARKAALRAEGAGGAGWRTKTVLALSAYYAGTPEDAYAAAEAAVRLIPPGDGSRNSLLVLTIFAEGRWKSIKEAVRAKRDWPPEWLTDLHSVYSVLRKHPFVTDGRIAWHHDLLEWLGVKDQARRALEEGIERFPDSDLLHARLRRRLLEDGNAAGLVKGYDELLAAQGETTPLVTFAARASVAAAEQFRRNVRTEEALTAYGRALQRFDRAVAADERLRPVLDREAALAEAGRSRVLYQRGDDGAALTTILASFQRCPDAAGDRDGLGFTPGETGQVLLARLRTRKMEEDATRLEAALAGLDQELLRPDRY